MCNVPNDRKKIPREQVVLDITICEGEGSILLQ